MKHDDFLVLKAEELISHVEKFFNEVDQLKREGFDYDLIFRSDFYELKVFLGLEHLSLEWSGGDPLVKKHNDSSESKTVIEYELYRRSFSELPDIFIGVFDSEEEAQEVLEQQDDGFSEIDKEEVYYILPVQVKNCSEFFDLEETSDDER